jgi:putative polysaccharide biosynthesis protein
VPAQHPFAFGTALTIFGRRSARKIPVWRRGFPFFLGKPRSAVERLRASGASQPVSRGPRWKRLLAAGVMTVGWPLVTFGDALRLAIKGGPETPPFSKLYSAALRRNVPPNQYARYAELEAFQAAEISDFLLPLDLRALHSLSQAQGASAADVQDKARFERACKAHHLACVTTIATFSDGSATGEAELRNWTAPFFVKALTGNRGAGAEQWTPAGRHFVSSSGRELSIGEIIEKLRPTNSIVQPVLEDCAELRALGSVALSSLRLVTAKGPSIPATVIAAALSLADKAQSLTSHSGSLCGIDVETGNVSAVQEYAEDREPLPIDPDNPLVGFELPYWPETLALVRKAHNEAFPGFVTLGWDVALTPAGPLLLETNVSWNMAMHQTLTGPLGRTRLADVIDELLGPAQAR